MAIDLAQRFIFVAAIPLRLVLMVAGFVVVSAVRLAGDLRWRLDREA